MTSGDNSFSEFPDNQPNKFRAVSPFPCADMIWGNVCSHLWNRNKKLAAKSFATREELFCEIEYVGKCSRTEVVAALDEG